MGTRRKSAGKNVAWLAGMIDADGSIGLHVQKFPNACTTYVPDVSLTTSCHKTKEHLEVLLGELGVGFHITERNPKANGWNKVWVFSTRGMKRVAAFLAIILDDLVTKEAEARTVLAFIEHRLSHGPRTPYTETEENFRSSLKSMKANRNATLSSEAICQAPNVIG